MRAALLCGRPPPDLARRFGPVSSVSSRLVDDDSKEPLEPKRVLRSDSAGFLLLIEHNQSHTGRNESTRAEEMRVANVKGMRHATLEKQQK